MKYKKFDDYIREYSKDIKTFSNKVAIATNENIDFKYFNVIKSEFDVKENIDIPTIISGDFQPKSSPIFESFISTYNYGKIPVLDVVYEEFAEETFVPKMVKDIKEIKKLNFPVTAYGTKEIDEYKTIGKLKACEKIYDSFRESPVLKTKFTVLAFQDQPLSIIETINRYELDVDSKRFKYLNEVNSIINKLYETYTNLQFYNVELVESIKGEIYITGLNKKLKLNPHQAKVVYECAYEDYYKSRIPNWAKKEIFNESVVPYYKRKAQDSKLRTSEHSIDYSKYFKD